MTDDDLAAARADFADCVLAALQAMPALERSAFVLHRFEKWTFSRIAHHQGVTAQKVEDAFNRAMQKISEACKPEGEAPTADAGPGIS